ncbi:MAG: glyoxalase superfamily protein, partial [Acidimicrobiales bacterium]
MRTLPDSPNLEHLRQQAKDLLAQLRAVQPGATLSDAQTAVAEQYGYRTWPDLKAEVDRRCAAVPTVDASAASAVAAAYGLGTAAGPLVAHERQWAGQAWVLTTDRGRWLARQLFDWFDDGTVEAEVLLA